MRPSKRGIYAADKAFTTAKVEYANANNALNAYKRQLSREDSVESP